VKEKTNSVGESAPNGRGEELTGISQKKTDGGVNPAHLTSSNETCRRKGELRRAIGVSTTVLGRDKAVKKGKTRDNRSKTARVFTRLNLVSGSIERKKDKTARKTASKPTKLAPSPFDEQKG